MTNNSFFTFQRATSDLVSTDKFWSKKTYSECKDEIVRRNIAETNHIPSKNMWFIRSYSFPISKTTTMSRLVKLAASISERFHIDCFQISLNREEGTASFLFDFYREENRNHTISLNSSELKYLQVFVLSTLGLPLPQSPSMLRFFLVQIYQKDPHVYTRLLTALRKSSVGKNDFELLRVCLLYIENKVTGIVK